MQISQFPKKILIILYKIHSIAHKAYVVGMAGSRWKRHIVVNSMQARLRAQLGDRSKYSGERRRRSVVVASIVLTITDPLRGSYPFGYYLQAALIRSCGASFACMELTIISRFQRPQASRKSLLHPLFYSFSVLSPLACFQCYVSNAQMIISIYTLLILAMIYMLSL